MPNAKKTHHLPTCYIYGSLTDILSLAGRAGGSGIHFIESKGSTFWVLTKRSAARLLLKPLPKQHSCLSRNREELSVIFPTIHQFSCEGDFWLRKNKRLARWIVIESRLRCNVLFWYISPSPKNFAVVHFDSRCGNILILQYATCGSHKGLMSKLNTHTQKITLPKLHLSMAWEKSSSPPSTDCLLYTSPSPRDA